MTLLLIIFYYRYKFLNVCVVNIRESLFKLLRGDSQPMPSVI